MTDTANYADLKALLSERRHTLDTEVRDRVREGRSERAHESGDVADHSDAHVRDDLSLALLQMQVETLARIDQAIGRIDAGEYGVCVECGNAISEPRLRALPFAARCRPCADGHEQEQGRALRLANPRGGSMLFPDTSRR